MCWLWLLRHDMGTGSGLPYPHNTVPVPRVYSSGKWSYYLVYSLIWHPLTSHTHQLSAFALLLGPWVDIFCLPNDLTWCQSFDLFHLAPHWTPLKSRTPCHHALSSYSFLLVSIWKTSYSCLETRPRSTTGWHLTDVVRCCDFMGEMGDNMDKPYLPLLTLVSISCGKTY